MQDKFRDDLQKQHKDFFEKVSAKLDKEAKDEENALRSQLDDERRRILREKKNRHQAEIEAQPGLSQKEIDAVRKLSLM